MSSYSPEMPCREIIDAYLVVVAVGAAAGAVVTGGRFCDWYACADAYTGVGTGSGVPVFHYTRESFS